MAPELASRGANLTHISLTIFMSYCICVPHDSVSWGPAFCPDNAFIKYSNKHFTHATTTTTRQTQTVEKSNLIPEKYHKIRQNCLQRLRRERRKLITVITIFHVRGKIDFYIISCRRFIGLTYGPVWGRWGHSESSLWLHMGQSRGRGSDQRVGHTFLPPCQVC